MLMQLFSSYVNWEYSQNVLPKIYQMKVICGERVYIIQFETTWKLIDAFNNLLIQNFELNNCLSQYFMCFKYFRSEVSDARVSLTL